MAMKNQILSLRDVRYQCLIEKRGNVVQSIEIESDGETYTYSHHVFIDGKTDSLIIKDDDSLIIKTMDDFTMNRHVYEYEGSIIHTDIPYEPKSEISVVAQLCFLVLKSKLAKPIESYGRLSS